MHKIHHTVVLRQAIKKYAAPLQEKKKALALCWAIVIGPRPSSPSPQARHGKPGQGLKVLRVSHGIFPHCVYHNSEKRGTTY
jgi:hypothetical protein